MQEDAQFAVLHRKIFPAQLYVPRAAVQALLVRAVFFIYAPRLVGTFYVDVPTGVQAVVEVQDGGEVGHVLRRHTAVGQRGRKFAHQSLRINPFARVHEVDVGHNGTFLPHVARRQIKDVALAGQLAPRNGVTHVQCAVQEVAVPVEGGEYGHPHLAHILRRTVKESAIVLGGGVVHHLHVQRLRGRKADGSVHTRLIALDVVVEVAELAHADGIHPVFVTAQLNGLLAHSEGKAGSHAPRHRRHFDRRGKVVERVRVAVFVERLPEVVREVLAEVAQQLQPHAVQLEGGFFERTVVEAGRRRGVELQIHAAGTDGLSALGEAFEQRSPFFGLNQRVLRPHPRTGRQQADAEQDFRQIVTVSVHIGMQILGSAGQAGKRMPRSCPLYKCKGFIPKPKQKEAVFPPGMF